MKKLLAIVALCLCLGLLAQKQTDRFAVTKIAKEMLDSSAGSVEESLLQQPYRYLGKGGQSYVFLSEDGKYVLKLFRGSRLQMSRFFSKWIPSLQSRAARQEEELKNALCGYRLAYERAKEETGVLGVHLDRHQPLAAPLILIDKIGIRHKIDPNSIPFVIQERAEVVAHLSSEEWSLQHLQSLRALLVKKRELKIHDGDANLMKNFGFVGGRAVQIDPGRFTEEGTDCMDKIRSSKEELKSHLQGELAHELDTMIEEYCREAI
jgi:hypothetical protein